MVIASMSIQKWTLLRDPRVEPPANSSARYCEEGADVDTFCQNSEVAICRSDTSNKPVALDVGRAAPCQHLNVT
jgi:hypothetical protein